MAKATLPSGAHYDLNSLKACGKTEHKPNVPEGDLDEFIQEIFNKQKAYFDSDATKSYEWRIDQLTRLENLCNENSGGLEAAMSSDFKPLAKKKSSNHGFPAGTAAFAKAELKSDEAHRCSRSQALRESDTPPSLSRAVWRRPWYRPFNGPLTLLFDPRSRSLRQAILAFSNSPKVWPAQQTLAGSRPKYFDPRGRHCRLGKAERKLRTLKAAFRLHLLSP